jgi:glycosyltransferase involved in cell wall biosynthesis
MVFRELQMKPIFSIITPSYNQGQFIERTIQSVLKQDIALEHIILDAQSKDNTAEIAKKYKDQIRFISEPDQGQADAISKGFKLAQGEFIGWLNSDDTYHEVILSKVLKIFETHPEIDLIYGNAYHIDAEDKIINEYPTEPFNLGRLKETCIICQPTVFFRRKIFEKVGYLNMKLHFCMDYEYWLRLATNKINFYYYPEFLANSRLHDDCKTMKYKLSAQIETMNMLKEKFNSAEMPWLIKVYILFYALDATLKWGKLSNFPIFIKALMCKK